MPEHLLSAEKKQRTNLCADEDSISAVDLNAAKDTKIILSVSGKQLDFPAESTSLLEALEQNGVAHEYQCRSGYCGACRCRMIKGNVAYCQKPLASLQQGEILPCCCMPLVDIELDI